MICPTLRVALFPGMESSPPGVIALEREERRPFCFVNFGHPPPLLFCSEFGKFLDIDKSRMVQFLPLGLEIPEEHPDRNRYFSMHHRQRRANSSDLAELTLIRPGD